MVCNTCNQGNRGGNSLYNLFPPVPSPPPTLEAPTHPGGRDLSHTPPGREEINVLRVGWVLVHFLGGASMWEVLGETREGTLS